MAIIIKRRPKPLPVSGYQPHPALPVITWPHFTPGERVRIIAKSRFHFKAWKNGDIGEVTKVCPALGMRDDHQEDLYFVKLDQPRVPGKEIVYLTYKELAGE